jgi:hypothetical protein
MRFRRYARLRLLSALALAALAVGCDDLASSSPYWDQTGWFEHDKMAVVQSRAWTVGEYKVCQSYAETANDEPLLSCEVDATDSKRFKVAFHGPTFIDSQPSDYVGQSDKAARKAFDWDCRKNNSDDVVISCWIKTDKPATQSANLPGASQRLLDTFSAPADWTENEEPPGRIPGGGGCPTGYRIIHHLSGPGGYVRHEDCVPTKMLR